MIRNPFSNSMKYHRWLHMFIWGACTFSAVMVAATNEIGFTGEGFCWLKESIFPGWFYLPVLGYLILASATVVVAVSRMSELKTIAIYTRKRMMRRMLVYVGMFIFLWSIPTMHHMIVSLGNFENESSLPFALDALGLSCQGFANACVWMSSPLFRTNVGLFFRRIYARLRRRSDDAEAAQRLLAQAHSDESDDVQRVDAAFRRETLRLMLNGMKQALQYRSSGIFKGHLDIVEYDPSAFTQSESDSSPENVPSPALPPAAPSPSTPLLRSPRHTETRTERRRRHRAEVEHIHVEMSRFFEYAPGIFQEIRAGSRFSPETFVEALEPSRILGQLSLSLKSTAGRSGSFFVFTPNKEFIIKTLSYSEAQQLRSLLRYYVEYLRWQPDSLLVRFFGLYCIHMLGHKPVYAVIMSNVFLGTLSIHEQYDLKGSWVHRRVGRAHDENPKTQGMDMDLCRQLDLPTDLRYALSEQLKRDATFLCSRGIMDYSILLGFHFNDLGAGSNSRRRQTASATSNYGSPPQSTPLPSLLHQAHLPLSPSLSASSPTLASPQLRAESPTTAMTSLSTVTMPTVSVPVTNGLRSRDGREVYYIGVIDILQRYDIWKQAERFTKVHLLRMDPNGVSVQNPERYLERFLHNWEARILFTRDDDDSATTSAVSLASSASAEEAPQSQQR
eukprot:TRINITY_DN881_c0_g1_i2.p1 TRINITY_DN881_c0_g1~~TRINITY_DN881_c0_g1_i2.p1  ORF type:complete len:673 (-),score=145.02 TRINITY_DN881_c0_g1_i2:126-2144(-)